MTMVMNDDSELCESSTQTGFQVSENYRSGWGVGMPRRCSGGACGVGYR